MPINYHVKKPMYCSNLDPNILSSVQGCKFKRDEIPEFNPMNRGRGKLPKPAVSPRQQIEPEKLYLCIHPLSLVVLYGLYKLPVQSLQLIYP